MKDNLLVSVIIPTYRRPKNLERAILSVLVQTYENFEIIVVDDNDQNSYARNKTEQIMQKYIKNNKVKYIKHETNKNGAAARNTGIKNSLGDYITFLDDDDEFLPTKIEEEIIFLQKNTDYNACYCLSQKFINNIPYYTTSYCKDGNLSLDVLMLKSEIYLPALMFKKKALIEINGFDETFTRHQDYEILLKYFESFRIGCVKKTLVKINIDDKINHPTLEEFERIKQIFLNTFQNKINEYDPKIINKIYRSHYFELFYSAVKERNVLKTLIYAYKMKPTIRFLYENKHKIISVIGKFRRIT